MFNTDKSLDSLIKVCLQTYEHITTSRLKLPCVISRTGSYFDSTIKFITFFVLDDNKIDFNYFHISYNSEDVFNLIQNMATTFPWHYI